MVRFYPMGKSGIASRGQSESAAGLIPRAGLNANTKFEWFFPAGLGVARLNKTH
jgi:hypothetical protein